LRLGAFRAQIFRRQPPKRERETEREGEREGTRYVEGIFPPCSTCWPCLEVCLQSRTLIFGAPPHCLSTSKLLAPSLSGRRTVTLTEINPTLEAPSRRVHPPLFSSFVPRVDCLRFFFELTKNPGGGVA
ncbi:unnamed protein product, partial [Ixodes persulcatus]